MNETVSNHYGSVEELVSKISKGLQGVGKSLDALRTGDLAAIDEFHFRGRQATLELADQMNLSKNSSVLDIGSGLGGPARTVAEDYDCHVTGVDLTAVFCEAASVMSEWVGLADRTKFMQGDATNLPFPDNAFDAAMTIHVAMNIAAKNKLYSEARRVLKPGGIFAVYDILQGEGGDVIYPAPWAHDSSISFMVTTDEMQILLSGAGFKILDVNDTSLESLEWIEARTSGKSQARPVPHTTQILFGENFQQMIENQMIGLREKRIRTVSFICEA